MVHNLVVSDINLLAMIARTKVSRIILGITILDRFNFSVEEAVTVSRLRWFRRETQTIILIIL